MVKVVEFPQPPRLDGASKRLKPPADLPPAERREFTRIVRCCPVDWFTPGSEQLLASYARHVTAARHVAKAIEAAMAEGRPEVLERLLKAQARESRLLCQTMTALRLTPRSVRPRNVSIRRLAQVVSPWGG